MCHTVVLSRASVHECQMWKGDAMQCSIGGECGMLFRTSPLISLMGVTIAPETPNTHNEARPSVE